MAEYWPTPVAKSLRMHKKTSKITAAVEKKITSSKHVSEWVGRLDIERQRERERACWEI